MLYTARPLVPHVICVCHFRNVKHQLRGIKSLHNHHHHRIKIWIHHKRECNHIITTRIDALYTNSTIIQEIKTDLFDQSFCFIQDWIYKWYCFSLSNFFTIINQTFYFTKNEDIEISTQGQIVLEMDLLLWKNNYNQSWGLSLTPHPLRKYINFKVVNALFFLAKKTSSRNSQIMISYLCVK